MYEPIVDMGSMECHRPRSYFAYLLDENNRIEKYCILTRVSKLMQNLLLCTINLIDTALPLS